VSNPDELILTPTNAVLVNNAEGSYSGADFSVFEVDTSGLVNPNKLIVTITASEEGKEGIPITITVTKGLDFGLYIDTAGDLTKVEDPSLTDLQAIFDYLESNAASDTSYVIQLLSDSVMTNYASKTSVSNVTVTLQGSPGGNSVTWNGTSFSGDGLIVINAGTTLVLNKNITLDGKNGTFGNSSRSAVFVGQNGKFKMGADSKITGCVGTNGAVWVYGAGGTAPFGEFVMEGGEISGNANGFSYGAVNVRSASFTMLDGKISGNNTRGVYAEHGGSKFVMEGGEISGNGTASDVFGMGVCLRGSNGSVESFTMKGGKIVNNGKTGTPGGGVFSGAYSSVTLDGRVDLRGNSVNVWASSSSSTGHGPIVLGDGFENLNEPTPIVVDTVNTNSNTYGTIEYLKAWWGSDPCLVGSAGAPADGDAIAQFTPGVAFRPSSSTSTATAVVFADLFTIGSDGRFNFNQ
jgi:hypothetical protein